MLGKAVQTPSSDRHCWRRPPQPRRSRVAVPRQRIPSAFPNSSLCSASAECPPSDFQTVPLQNRPAKVEQAKLDQFLFQLFGRRVFQRLGHFVEKQLCKLLSGSVQDLSDPGSREGLAKPGGQLLCHLRRPHSGMIGPETEYGIQGLTSSVFDLSERRPSAGQQLVA